MVRIYRRYGIRKIISIAKGLSEPDPNKGYPMDMSGLYELQVYCMALISRRMLVASVASERVSRQHSLMVNRSSMGFPWYWSVGYVLGGKYLVYAAAQNVAMHLACLRRKRGL